MINILFSGNDKVFDGILSCMLSILKRTQTKEAFRVYVYTMDVSHIKKEYLPISDSLISYLDTVIKRFNKDNQVLKVDVTALYMKEFDKCPNENAYCSPYTLLRLFADCFDFTPDKILYLDVDLFFNKDIMLLYDMDITKYEYAAARDHYGKFLLYPNYINAGVLLFNMKKMRETKILEKARALIKTKKLIFADQSALIRSTTIRKVISSRFNDQKFLYKNTVIRHFSKRLYYFPYPHTDNIKQWHMSKVYRVFKYHQFDDIYEDYIYYKKKYELEVMNNDK